jgi:hypothetical protein
MHAYFTCLRFVAISLAARLPMTVDPPNITPHHLALGASRVRSFFAGRPHALQGLSRVSGALLIFLGLRLAASKQ